MLVAKQTALIVSFFLFGRLPLLVLSPIGMPSQVRRRIYPPIWTLCVMLSWSLSPINRPRRWIQASSFQDSLVVVKKSSKHWIHPRILRSCWFDVVWPRKVNSCESRIAAPPNRYLASCMPGLCNHKGLEPLYPIYQHALANGSPEARETAAKGDASLCAWNPWEKSENIAWFEHHWDSYGSTISKSVLQGLGSWWTIPRKKPWHLMRWKSQAMNFLPEVLSQMVGRCFNMFRWSSIVYDG